MSVNPQLLPVMKDTDTIRTEVMTNIIKMLSYRHWINSDDAETQISSISKQHNDDNIYKIKLSINLNTFEFYHKPPADSISEENALSGKTVYVKILNQNVTGVNKSPIITEFLHNYKNDHKILIVEKISDKAEKQLLQTPYVEVFTEPFFLVNLVEYDGSPQYEVLSEAQTEQFLKAYQLSRRKMSKMDDTEAASKYLFLRKGQIVRIIRNSKLCGNSIAYRVVQRKGSSKI
jgi:DNA-directed RNA polymerase subunit H (RpoH/RPB5)